VLSALGIAAVRSEYGSRMEPLYRGVRSPVWEALLTFALVTAGIVVVFGVAPCLLKRLMSRHLGGPDA
jgi:hypothetical protein